MQWEHTFIKQARMPAKGFELKHFKPDRFIGYQRSGDLLVRVLSWSSFSERGAGELSADNTGTCSRANRTAAEKGGGCRVG